MGTRCKIELYGSDYCPPDRALGDTPLFSINRTFVYRWYDSFPEVVGSDILRIKAKAEKLGYGADVGSIARLFFEMDEYFPHTEVFTYRDGIYAMRNTLDYVYIVSIADARKLDPTTRDLDFAIPEWTLAIKRGKQLEEILSPTTLKKLRKKDFKKISDREMKE